MNINKKCKTVQLSKILYVEFSITDTKPSIEQNQKSKTVLKTSSYPYCAIFSQPNAAISAKAIDIGLARVSMLKNEQS